MATTTLTPVDARMLKACNYAARGLRVRCDFLEDIIFSLPVNLSEIPDDVFGPVWDALREAFDAHPYRPEGDAVATGAALFARVREIVRPLTAQ